MGQQIFTYLLPIFYSNSYLFLLPGLRVRTEQRGARNADNETLDCRRKEKPLEGISLENFT